MMRIEKPALGLVLAASAVAFACSSSNPDEQVSGQQAQRPVSRAGMDPRELAARWIDELGPSAIRRAAEISRRPQSAFRVTNVASVHNELSGEDGVHFKLADEETGSLYTVLLDPSGEPIDATAFRERERALQLAQFGKLHPRLHRLLSSANEEVLRVSLWLETKPQVDVPIPAMLGRATAKLFARNALRSEVASVHADLDRERQANVQPTVSEIVARLADLGAPATTDAFTPLVTTELTRTQLGLVGEWPEVLQIDQTSTSGPELDITRSVIRTQIVHSQGIRGQGVQVGVVEVGTLAGNLPFDNPFLAGVFQDLSLACPGTFSFHGTTVVGVIRSSNSTIRGVAPESTLGFFPTCDGSDPFAQNRGTAAANWGARIINLSWGDLVDSHLVLSPNDRFFDSMVLNRARTVVKSAGNHGEAEDGRVTSPGLAYNVITVGNFDDRNTTGLGDDAIADDSSYGNPISIQGDREKPEVAAPGTNIRSTTTESPWLNPAIFFNSGTSFAAPHVSGLAALLMDVSAAFEVRPEAVKAVIMASAVHNVIGDARLSQHDGAGGINAEMAVKIAREQGGSGWEGLSYSCSAPAVTSLPLNFTANKQTRVVIAWGTDPNYVDYQDQPNADIDLQITAPNGSVVDASASFDNSYEIVDFRPSVSGVHSVNIQKLRCDLSPRRLGVAWLIR